MAEAMSAEAAVEAVAKHGQEIKDLNEKVDEGTRSASEVKERLDKWEPEFKAACDKINELHRTPIQTEEPAYVPRDVTTPEKRHEYLVRARADEGSDLERYHILSDYLVLSAAAANMVDMRQRSHRNMDMLTKSPAYGEFNHLRQRFGEKVALDTTSESEWVPAEILSATLVDKIRDVSRVAPLFPRIPMPGPTFKMPLLTADASGYLISEATVAPEDSGSARITSSQPTAAQATWDAVKLAVRVVTSTEMLEDMSFEGAAWLTGHVAQVAADIIDDAIINGDTASTHMDSSVTAATDRRKAWLGLRAMAVDQSYSTDSSTWNSDGILTARQSMGKYGGFTGSTASGCVLLLSYNAYGALLKDDDLKTVDKFGPAATVATGEVARVSGVPVVVTEWIATNLNASGVYDGSTTTKTAGILANRGAFALGDRRAITVKSSDLILMEYDQVVAVSTWRGDFEDIYPIASNETVHYLYNITS
jgi:HK97 family phage major capsid protein